MEYVLSIMLAIFANFFYYIIQKMTPSDVNPVISLFVTYISAALICLLLFPVFNKDSSFIDSFKKINWTSIALAFAIVGLEVGFLCAFRAGWNIGNAGILVNAIAAIMLIPIALIFFKENLRPINIIGVFVCILGLIFITRK